MKKKDFSVAFICLLVFHYLNNLNRIWFGVFGFFCPSEVVNKTVLCVCCFYSVLFLLLFIFFLSFFLFIVVVGGVVLCMQVCSTYVWLFYAVESTFTFFISGDSSCLVCQTCVVHGG